MKKITLCFLFFALIYSANTAFAQERLMEGKVVDSLSKPVWGAIVRISKQGKLVTAVHSGNDGVFRSELIDEGQYDIEVIIEGKTVSARKLFFNAEAAIKRYYILKVLNDRVEVSKVGEKKFTEMDIRERRDVQRAHQTRKLR